MMKPMMRKVAFGVPAVALSAALACTMAGCGGTEGGQGGSGDNAPAGQTVNGVQTAEVAGFTIESVGDGSYYRGAAERQDGFWLRVKITNNNEAAKAPSAFSARAAVGTFDAGDAVFDASGDQRLNADTKTQAVELGEGAQMDANAKIEPGQSVEFIYFWTTKDNYYGPITVQFDKNATGGTDPRTMRFDTTGKDSDATFNPEGSTKRFSTSTCSRAPQKEAEALQGNFGGKGEIDEVDINGATWTRYTQTGTYYMFTVAPCGTTVRMFIDSGITWEDAIPMMQNVTLK